MRDAAFGLLPYLVRCAFVVGAPVGMVGILIDIKVFVRLGGDQLLSFADGAIRALAWIGPDDFGAKGMQNPLALFRGAAWNAEGHRESERGAEHGVSDAGVAAGGIEQPSTAQSSGALRFAHDGGSSAIFHRAARVVPLGLAQDLDTCEAGSDALKPQQWRVPDALKQLNAQLCERGSLKCNSHGT